MELLVRRPGLTARAYGDSLSEATGCDRAGGGGIGAWASSRSLDFALSDEAALLMASYPRGNRPARPFPYCNEVMTGFEYTAAVHMLYEGQIANGLKVIAATRARYDGERRSPFNEAECGHHYARAMASWAAILALTGFHYSAVTQSLQLKAASSPQQTFWSTGHAWGTAHQTPQSDGIDLDLTVLHGQLPLHYLTLTGAGTLAITPRTLTKGYTETFHIPDN